METAFQDVARVDVDGTSLAWVERGAGEPVVFVHGSVSDLRTWEPQLPEIGRAFRAIAYSRRYSPPNEDLPDGADDPMLPHVGDLAAFLPAIGAAPAHLVGNSWGAFIALLAARRHPDRVRTLVLEEPPVLPLFASTPPRPAELLRTLLTRPRTALAILRFGAGTLAPVQQALRRGEDEKALASFVDGVGGPGAFAAFPAARQQQMRDNLRTLRAQLLGAGFPPLTDDDVRSVRVPVLLLTGARSPALFQRLTDALEELLPYAERAEIPDASHGMHEENAAATNQAILAFLERHRDR